MRYDDLIADPPAEFLRLMSFVLGDDARVPSIAKIKSIVGVRHVLPSTPLRGAMPVYAADARFASPAAVGAIAAALGEALSHGLWANALAAAQPNETVLALMGANPLYPWKTPRAEV